GDRPHVEVQEAGDGPERDASVMGEDGERLVAGAEAPRPYVLQQPIEVANVADLGPDLRHRLPALQDPEHPAVGVLRRPGPHTGTCLGPPALEPPPESPQLA